MRRITWPYFTPLYRGVLGSMGFYEYALPFFLLVFLILCFVIFLWVKQQRMSVQTDPEYKRPSKTKEGFQTTPGTWITNYGTTGTIRNPIGGSGVTLPATGQFDMPAELQALYGTWEITSQDSYYDDYEQNELAAIATQSSKFTPIIAAPATPTIFGSTLGAFDSETTRIPWDNDNSSQAQSDIVWGFVSEQASRSIFLKTYINEVAANMTEKNDCGSTDSTSFCYKSPLLGVSTSDQKIAYAMQTGEALLQGVAFIPMMYISEINMDMSNFSEVVSKRYQTFSGALGKQATHALESVETHPAQAADTLKMAVGAKKLQGRIEAQRPGMRARLREVARAVVEAAYMTRNIIMGTVTGAALVTNIASWLTGGVLSALAYTATAIAITLDIFFGVIGGLCMAIQAIIDPIINAMFETGGVCPDGYNQISDLLSGPALTVIADLIPMGSFLQSFDPYVCWAKDSNGIANVRLKVPPKSPDFMSDRTLSLVYNAYWVSGQSGVTSVPDLISIELDPLPNGYVWLAESDLANSPNTNDITTLALNLAGSSKTTTSYIGGSVGSGKLPSYVAVQACEPDTTPSADGKQCLQTQARTDVQPPTLSACPAGQVDDGYNCWTSAIDPACKSPQFSYQTTTTWSDAYGYFSPTPPSTCANNPGIAKAFKDRITCPTGYEHNTFGLIGELFCYRSCPAGQIRSGALCLGATQTHQRNYMFGSHTIYKTQQYDTKRLNSLADVTIPYCDFASKNMLDKMGQFYYSQGLLNPQVNEDGTITIQIITKFFGVISSSELSCDVACSIDFITYDPISGSNYSATTGCKSSYDEDPMFKGCPFCYRRFYFIRGDHDPQGEFTVTGCTFADYTAPEAMVKSSDNGANFVPSIYSTPSFPSYIPNGGSSTYNGTMKKWNVVRKNDANILNLEQLEAEWNSGRIMNEASVGLLEAGISIVASMLGWAPGVGPAAALATRSAITKGAAELTETMGARAAGNASREVVNSISASTARNVVSGLDEAGMEAAQAAIKADAVQAARNAGVRGTYTEGMTTAERAAADEAAANAFATQALRNMEWPITSSAINVGVGILGGAGAGLLNSMYLDKLLKDAIGGAIEPRQVPMVTTTTIVGTDPYNLSVAINQNWWTASQGAIYELAEGYTPTIKPCQITSTGGMVQVSSAYCTNKYIVRNMVNMYHNTYQNAHIKQIKAIEPRGTTGCYYKWDEVEYNPTTNSESSILTQKEVILTNKLKDTATCTFLPTGFVPIDLVAYPVRSYIDPSTVGTATPRTIYPTRSLVFTSDVYARYVRVCPPATSGGSGSSGTSMYTNDGFINLAQISVFDVSGFNISTAMTTYATSVMTGAAESDSPVSGTVTEGSTLDSVWQPKTTSSTEYWEVDLGKTVNISEVVYVGGAINLGRNIGVQIQFLYTNGATDTPIYTYILPTVDATQIINLASSSYSTPMFPLAGPIQIPRPVKAGVVLHSDEGCMNKCEDKGIIDLLVQQYNQTHTNSTIMKVLQGVTSSQSTCEYKAEVLTSDIAAGSSTVAKNSLTTQTLSMQVNLASKQVGQNGLIQARYLKILPSRTPGTILEFSKVIVRSGRLATDGKGLIEPYTYISATGNIIQYNMMYQLDEIAKNNAVLGDGGNTYLQKVLLSPSTSDGSGGSSQPQTYPNIFRAGDNDPETFFVVDMGPAAASGSGSGSSSAPRNSYIYDITFIGVSEGSLPPIGRTKGGIKGIQIILYSDLPGITNQTAFDDTYDNIVYRYLLPTDAVSPAPILVSQPPKCSFTLGATTVLSAPQFLQAGTPPLSAPDTSGGVFSFSSIVNTLGSAWSALQPLNSTDMTAPIKTNLQQSDLIVHKMLETVSANQTILNTGVRCSDPGSLARMMTAYNIAKAPKSTEEFGVKKHTMLRILKAGQSTLKTCDLLFEDQEDDYDDYIQDTSGTDIIKTIKAARFTFKTSTGSTAAVPDPAVPIDYDISANALGIMSNASALSTVYSGPYANVNCRDPGLLQLVKAAVTPAPMDSPLYTKQATFVAVAQSFQSTPLTCEYKMAKVQKIMSKNGTISVTSNPMETYVKAEFTLGADGYSISFASAKEYDPMLMTLSTDKLTVYLPGPSGRVKVDLPSLFDYDPRHVVSKRVNSQLQNI